MKKPGSKRNPVFVPSSLDLHTDLVRAVDSVGDRAARGGVADGANDRANALQLLHQGVLRLYAEREHDAVRRDAFDLTGPEIGGDHFAGHDALQLMRGQENRPRGPQALHLVVEELEPGTRGDLVRHFQNGDLVAGFVEDLGGLESGHAAADDYDALIFRTASGGG